MLHSTRRLTARLLREVVRGFDAAASRVDVPRRRISRQEKRFMAQHQRWRGVFAGRPGFVIGNGPSLRGQDLGPLAGQVTFVANGFWKHPIMTLTPDGDASPWQPTVYSLIDPVYFDGSQAMAAFFAELRKRATRAMFLVPSTGMASVRAQGLLPLERTRPCVFRGLMFDNREYSFDLTRAVPHLACVSLMGIAAALFAGCNPIYLMGLDHDWLTTPEASSRHFYSGLTVDNHARSKELQDGSAHSYLENMQNMVSLYRTYHRLGDLASKAGQAICNATDGGFLDVYPRVRYADVLGELGLTPSSPVGVRHIQPVTASAGDSTPGVKESEVTHRHSPSYHKVDA